MLLAEAALLHWASDIAARFPWLRREANPPNKMKIANKYATVARLVGAEEVKSDIWLKSNQQDAAAKPRALYLLTTLSSTRNTVVNINLY